MSIQRQNLRAVIWPLLNPDTGLLLCDRFSWREIEKQPGVYTFDGISRAVERAMSIKRFALLCIQPDLPEGCSAPVPDFVRLVGALGEKFGGERAILGVDVLYPGPEAERTAAELAAIAAAFDRAFPQAIKFVHAGSALASVMKRDARQGLIVTPQNARQYADRWPELPLRMCVDPAQPEAIQTAIDCHVSILEANDASGANAATHAGYRFQVDAVQVDDRQQEAGQIEATVAVSNVGTLPCYSEARFCLRLSGSDVPDARVFPLPLQAAAVKPGASLTVSQTLDITGLAPGEYEVQVGLFFDGTEYPVSFGIEGRISDGYYEGRLILCL